MLSVWPTCRNKVYREWCTDSSPLVNNGAAFSTRLQARATMQDPFAGRPSAETCAKCAGMIMISALLAAAQGVANQCSTLIMYARPSVHLPITPVVVREGMDLAAVQFDGLAGAAVRGGGVPLCAELTALFLDENLQCQLVCRWLGCCAVCWPGWRCWCAVVP